MVGLGEIVGEDESQWPGGKHGVPELEGGVVLGVSVGFVDGGALVVGADEGFCVCVGGGGAGGRGS
jgi:hypothetical protein